MYTLGRIVRFVLAALVAVIAIVVVVIVLSYLFGGGSTSVAKATTTELQTKVADLTTANGALKAEADKVPVLQKQVADLNTQLVEAKNASGADSQTVIDLKAQLADLQTKLDTANTGLANAQAAAAAAFDFTMFGSTQTVDMSVMRFPSFIDLRVGIETPGGGWMSAVYFATDAPHVAINRLICDDECLQVIYHPATGNSITLLDKDQGIDLFNMVWVGGDQAANIPQEVLSVMKARGVKDTEILRQNSYALFLGDVAKGSWIEFKFKDDPVLQVNKGSSVGLTADVDQLTRNTDGSMNTEITYFVPGLETFRWTDTTNTFGVTP